MLSPIVKHFSFFVDKPVIEDKPITVVNESEKVILTRKIDSNPLSNVSWYNGSQFVYTQFSVKKATLIIEKASCTDTTNFTILASNTEKENVTARLELFVNCKCFIHNQLQNLKDF